MLNVYLKKGARRRRVPPSEARHITTSVLYLKLGVRCGVGVETTLRAVLSGPCAAGPCGPLAGKHGWIARPQALQSVPVL